MNTSDMSIFFASTLFILLWQVYQNFAANCNGYDTENECIAISGCGWEDKNETCYCASNVTIDIMFSLDSSWSVSESDFQTALNWFADYVETSLSQDARIAITNFAAEAFLELSFSESGAMSNAELKNFVENDVPYRGNDGLGTDTYDAITITTDLFDTESKDLSTKALIILTDGKPCCTNRGQNVDVCSLTSSLTTRGIYTYIIGVGNFDVSKVDCLVDDPDNDVALIDDFDEDEFNTLLDPLGDITCPVDYEVTITEVKIESDGTDGRTVPFIEFYNPSNKIKLPDLTFSGVVTGTPIADNNLNATVAQGDYLVLYDASWSAGGENVTCEECTCTKRGKDFCASAVYIGCDGTYCSFNPSSSFTNGNWFINITDLDGSVLDTVIYDATYPNLTTLPGYSFELKNKGFDNDEGGNWDRSCNIYGSPGSEPLKNCTEICSTTMCQANVPSQWKDLAVVDDNDNTQCDCDDVNHYYSDGCSCTLVPPPGECYVYWVKNVTGPGQFKRYYEFIWVKAQTSEDHQYRLGYPVGGSYQYITLYNRYKIVTDFDTSIGIDATAGTVQTVMHDTYSYKVNCTSITQSPTTDPTPAPSPEPTVSPTKQPTEAPTFSNPYLFIGGEICEQDRCDCYGMELNCVGDAIFAKWEEGATRFLTIEQRPINFDQPTLVKYYVEYIGGSNNNETDDTEDQEDEYDYNISNSSDTAVTVRRRRNVRRRELAMKHILNKKYPGNGNDIDINYVGENGNRGSLFSLSRSLLSDTMNCTQDCIRPMSGEINVTTQFSDADETSISGNYATVQFKVNENSVNTTQSDFVLYRIVLESCDVYQQTAHVYSCRLIYPSDVYILIDSETGESNTLTETEFPAWLWWLIAALAVFLIILAWLVYRFWWKNRAGKVELLETEDQLEAAIAEDELGFGNDLGQGNVGFNPLAAGNPNGMRTGNPHVGGTNPLESNDIDGRADVAVDKFEQKKEFGQVAPKQYKGYKGGGANDLSQPLL